MNTLAHTALGAAIATAIPFVFGAVTDYFGQPAKVTAQATSTPYFALIPAHETRPTFSRDLASLRFPPQIDKGLQERLLTRATMFDNAAVTARAECVHQVTVTNNTPKPVKHLTVTADLLIGYGYPGGAVTAGGEPQPTIEKLIPGASASVLLFSMFSCDLGGHNIRVFNDDDSADVDVTGPLPLFVVMLAQNWGYVLIGILAFIAIGSISDAAKHRELKRVKAELAKYKPTDDAVQESAKSVPNAT